MACVYSLAAERPAPDRPWLEDAMLHAAERAGLGVLVARVTPHGVRALYANEAVAGLLGWTREELLEGDPTRFLAAGELPRVRGILEAVAGGEPRRELLDVVGSDGTARTLEVQASPVQSGVGGVVVCFCSDPTGRVRAQEARAATEERFRRLFDAAPDGVVICRDGRVVFANPAAARLLGVAAPVELVGAIWDDVLGAPARRLGAVEGGVPLTPEQHRIRCADGQERIVEVVSRPFEADDARDVISFARDCTERVRLQEQLARTDRLASLGTLAAGVAHEVNNPLAFMSLGLELLTKRLREAVMAESERERLLSTIGDVRRGADRVADIVRELKTFSRVEGDQAQLVDLAEILEAARRIVSPRARHVAFVDVDVSGLPRVVAHAGRLEQVFVNLLLNAAQAFDQHREENRIEVRGALLDDGRVEVDIVDNGPGIPQETLGRIFDPFFTTKAVGEGTGLGLSIVHGIVGQLGGEIRVESRPGHTRFRVFLPVGDAQGVEPRRELEVRRATRMRVLVIDDEPVVGQILRKSLEPRHEVTVVGSGQRAIAVLSGEEPFDAILCDLAMPGTSGMDIVEWVRSRDAALLERFVLMTGGAVTSRMQEFLDAWEGPALDKPFGLTSLEAALSEVLGRTRASRY